jgi:hypothetical protein
LQALPLSITGSNQSLLTISESITHLEANVKKVLSTKDELTISRMRKFARRARVHFKLMYYYLFQMILTAMAEGDEGRAAKEAIEKITRRPSRCTDVPWTAIMPSLQMHNFNRIFIIP